MTVTAIVDSTVLYSDRLKLDKASARAKFAEATNNPALADDLRVVRELILEHLAGPVHDTKASDQEADPETVAQALNLLDRPDILDQVAATVRELGYSASSSTGHLPVIIYLALVSRLLDRPINIVVSGPSAAGKSYLITTTARLIPDDAIYALSGMSERLLAYTDADLRYRMLFVGEASALHREGIGASMLRTIAWEGKLVYETIEKTADGLKPRRIEKPGPTGFITTTTGTIERELNTRVLEISVPDTPAATRIILQATAERANGHAPDEPDLTVWHAAQRWLEHDGLRTVTIPFANRLANLVPDNQVRWRRDFTQLLTLIQAHALLYQRQRQRSEDGRIIAEQRDYEAVYQLVGPIFQAIAAAGVTPEIRQTVDAVSVLTPGVGETVGMARLVQHLKLDRSAVQRRVNRAVVAGYLVNEETRKRQPHKLRTGDPLPEVRPALPSPKELFADPSCPTAQVHNDANDPHSDAKTTCASTRVQSEPLHKSVPKQDAWGDATNSGADALGHLCSEDAPRDNTNLESSLCPECRERTLDTDALRIIGRCTVCMTDEEYERWKPIAYSGDKA